MPVVPEASLSRESIVPAFSHKVRKPYPWPLRAYWTYLLLRSQPLATKLASTTSACDFVIEDALRKFTSRSASIDEIENASFGESMICSSYEWQRQKCEAVRQTKENFGREVNTR